MCAAISAVLFLHDEFFLEIIGVPREIWGDASLYLRWIGVFVWVQSMYMAFISFLRGYSLLKLTMVCSLVMNVLNIGGNLVLINGWGPVPALGVAGVCVSTNISKCLGFLLIVWLFRRHTQARLSFRYLRPFPFGTLRKILSLGIPCGGETFSYQFSQTVIMKFVNVFGIAVITTKIYAYIIAMVSYVYSQSLAMATQILVGYFKGAGDNEEVDRRVKFTILVSVLLSGTISLLVYLHSDAVFSIFTDDPEVHALGRTILFIEIFLEIGRAVNMSMVMALNAAGDVRAPITVGIIFMWGIATFAGDSPGYGRRWRWMSAAAGRSFSGGGAAACGGGNWCERKGLPRLWRAIFFAPSALPRREKLCCFQLPVILLIITI